MSGPLRESITHLDFTVTCCPPKFLGKHHCDCAFSARWFVQFHMTGRCTHPACDESGNLQFLVCDTHLKALEASADRTARKLNPPDWVRWFRVDPFRQRCPSCGRLVQSLTDIVQVTRSIE